MTRHIPALLLTLLITPSTALAQLPPQIGVNLDASGAFVDIVKQTNRYTATSFDSLGWPQSDFSMVLVDGRPVPEWNGSIDDPSFYRIDYSGRYLAQFTGQATVRATGTAVTIENARYDAASNTSSFDLVVGGYPGANHGLVFLDFSATKRRGGDAPGNGITQLVVNRPGYALNSGKLFTDEYLTLCTTAHFVCYRFYNLQNIWDGEPAWPAKTRWSMRKTPLDASQAAMTNTNGKRDAWCWEYIVALSNILRKDVWINVHQSCDSMYVASLASYLKASLHPAINIYVESSNEVWSPTQATHGPYNQADAQARGITFDQNHARRTVELSKWFGAVFGSSEINKRIRVILAGQHAYQGRSDNHLTYIRNAFGEPKNFVYATSSALYFGSTRASSSDALQVANGMFEDIGNQISNPQAATYRLNHINKAKTWDLPGGCTSYEGGPSIPEGGNTANLYAQIYAHRIAAMADVIKRNYLEGWRDLGGGLALYFTLTSSYNRYGCWGITDDYTKPDRNCKMQALRDMLNTSTSVRDVAANGIDGVEVYPNPARDHLTISAKRNGRVRITDLLGREVWRGMLTAFAQVDILAWTPGWYLLHANERVVRFMKQ